MLKKIIFLSVALIAFGGSLYFFSTPWKLRKLPKADKEGLVLNVKKIEIEGVKHPLNSSIIEYGNDYLLVFRIQNKAEDSTAIVLLDNNFKQKKPYVKIDLKSKTAQDARIFKFNNGYYLTYNDPLFVKDYLYRAMHLASLNENFEVNFTTCLDLNIKPVEKNWVPFVDEDKLLLAYSLMPHKIMELQDLKTNSLKHYVYPNNPCFTRFHWEFGAPRGGTPAKLVDGEYLAFFHSCFKGINKAWYVMGAYTFQAKPPFKITRVSKYPIILSNITSTRITYPAGFVLGKEKDKEVIFVSYGENDTCSKIMTIDKAKLFESLKKVD
ncbi:MAG: hypothetical protein HZB76_06910 [Chlamydiae bacterium]|nr:hypothetical protein [Chlamydiota bacterium]